MPQERNSIGTYDHKLNPNACDGITVRTVRLRNAEDLRHAVQGADLNIVQLVPGAFEGELTHAQIGTLGVSAGDFKLAVRARGVMNANLVTIGMMVAADGEVKQWDYDVIPGDVLVFPKTVEQEGKFSGRSNYVTLTLSEEDLALHSSGEGELADPDFWTRIHRFRPASSAREYIRKEIAAKVMQLRQGSVPNTPAATAYLRRSLIETFIVGVLDQQSPSTHVQHCSASKLVRAVEDYARSRGHAAPVHISELCTALNVSRRTLHRAFHEVLGIGPAEYLRLARLAYARRLLTRGDHGDLAVSEVAIEAGFSEFGRFAAYYRRLFRELPSQTNADPHSAASGGRAAVNQGQ